MRRVARVDRSRADDVRAARIGDERRARGGRTVVRDAVDRMGEALRRHRRAVAEAEAAPDRERVRAAVARDLVAGRDFGPQHAAGRTRAVGVVEELRRGRVLERPDVETYASCGSICTEAPRSRPEDPAVREAARGSRQPAATRNTAPSASAPTPCQSVRDMCYLRRVGVSELGLVVGAERLADPLGQRFRGQAGLVALAAQLLDGHVARGVDLGARDDAGRAVLVPDPDVLHLQLEERVARLRHVLQVELVAEVRRVLGQHAVAEEREDRGVLLLQRELELCLELVELVEMRHRIIIALPTRPAPGRARGSRARGRARPAAPARSAARAGVDAESGGPARRSARRRRAAGRGRSCAARSAVLRPARGPGGARSRAAARAARGRSATCAARPRR